MHAEVQIADEFILLVGVLYSMIIPNAGRLIGFFDIIVNCHGCCPFNRLVLMHDHFSTI